jgi:hypothetical protein
MTYETYHWFNIANQTTGTSSFDGAQLVVRHDKKETYLQVPISELCALRAINKWNASTNHWKYWL